MSTAERALLAGSRGRQSPIGAVCSTFSLAEERQPRAITGFYCLERRTQCCPASRSSLKRQPPLTQAKNGIEWLNAKHATQGRRQNIEQGTRDELLRHLAEAVAAVTLPHPTRVAVDGPPAAGKTTLADELAIVLRAHGREIIRASIESFLLPRAQRYRRGQYSAEGCYHDSFDYEALHRFLLEPLGPGGGRKYKQAVYDKAADAEAIQPFMTAPADAVLLFDGVFLLRPELIDRWDLRIFVSVAFEKTLSRGHTRDLPLYGSATEVERRFRDRYRPSQQFYFETARPTERADVIVHNDEPQQPAWEARPR